MFNGFPFFNTVAGFFTERSSLRPSSPYSASKTVADLLVLAWRRMYGLPVTDFTDGLRKTIHWYVENRKWWENHPPIISPVS